MGSPSPNSLEDFFRNPEKVLFLSPNGEYLAYTQPWQRHECLCAKIGSHDEPLRLTEATARNVAGYFWKGNDRIIYIQDSGGDENYHLFSVDITGKNKRTHALSNVRVSVVDDLEDVENKMIIAMNRWILVFSMCINQCYHRKWALLLKTLGILPDG